MPRKSKRNITYKARLERQLTSMERQVLKDLRQHLSRAASTSCRGATEFMDIVSDSELDDLAARIAESDSLKIDEIEDALALLRQGRHGVCQMCGKEISARRLKARPSAILCLECKKKQEKAHVASELRVHGPADVEIDVGLGLTDSDRDDKGVDELMEEMELRDLL